MLTYVRAHKEQAWDDVDVCLIRVAYAFRSSLRQEFQTRMLSSIIKAADSENPSP